MYELHKILDDSTFTKGQFLRAKAYLNSLFDGTEHQIDNKSKNTEGKYKRYTLYKKWFYSIYHKSQSKKSQSRSQSFKLSTQKWGLKSFILIISYYLILYWLFQKYISFQTLGGTDFFYYCAEGDIDYVK